MNSYLQILFKFLFLREIELHTKIVILNTLIIKKPLC